MRLAPPQSPRATLSHTRAPPRGPRARPTSPQSQPTRLWIRCPPQSLRRAALPRQTRPSLSKRKFQSNSPRSNKESPPTLRRHRPRPLLPQPLPRAWHSSLSTPRYPRCFACYSLPACIFYHAHYHGEGLDRNFEVPETPPIAESIGPIFHAQSLRVE